MAPFSRTRADVGVPLPSAAFCLINHLAARPLLRGKALSTARQGMGGRRTAKKKKASRVLLRPSSVLPPSSVRPGGGRPPTSNSSAHALARLPCLLLLSCIYCRHFTVLYLPFLLTVSLISPSCRYGTSSGGTKPTTGDHKHTRQNRHALLYKWLPAGRRHSSLQEYRVSPASS